jgi:class 3 adenylate cyclase/tetratricopeptide (TPR) repeat protein
VICPNCSSENDAGAKFCNDCGASLAAGCPNCGAINKPGAKFCNECGTALSGGSRAQSTAPTPAASGTSSAQVGQAERKLVTVLFADIVGFTPFAEQRDAEEVRDTLSRYFDLCSETIGRYGGTIEKFIGDAVMAVWGAPVAFEDDAERAVRAALDLIAAVPTLAPGGQARAGVLTGEAAVTIGATNQGMVAGDMVNTAARLQSVAEAGTVLVGEATMRAASDAIVFEPAGDHELKGKVSPVPAWRAVRVVAERGGRNRSEALEAPFVGRSAELRMLKDLLHATGEEKRVRLVSVMGPAGIGKSRLAWELLKYIDGLVETVYWHNGRSPAYGEGITFWALGEMIRGRAGLVEADDEATTRQKIRSSVETWVPEDAQRGLIEKALLTLLGVESGVPSDQLFGAWRTFFERISEQGTVALVFEDVHFADSGLLDFIDHMLDWSRGHPIYIVTLARPELLERRPDWGAGKRNFISIYLEPLSAEEMRALLAGLAPGLPEGAVATIVDRADGIPLYAVETVRMLVADGRLEQNDGVYVPVGDLTQLAVPDTLTALISSRLDALGPDDRSLIHDAAVLGQSFTVEALGAIAGRSAADLEPSLKNFIRRELLTRDVDERSAQVGQFVFMQGLIREVAYNTLSKKDRKARHLAAARYFEQLGSDELASALAGHYLAAQQNASEGAEADALAAQARIALRAAAERAANLGANEQAAAFLEQAIGITSDQAEQAVLLERAASVLGKASMFDRSLAMSQRAIDIYRESGDRLAAANAIADHTFMMLNARKDREAYELLVPALTEYGDLWPDPAIVSLKLSAARAYSQTSDFDKALALSDEALAEAERLNSPVFLARGLLSKGSVLAGIGRFHEGVALMSAGGDIARQNELTELLLIALTLRGYHLGEVDNDAAESSYREGFDLARRIGHRAMTRQFVNNIGYTGFLTGEWDYALNVMDAELDTDLDLSSRVWILSNELIIRASRGEDVQQRIATLDVYAAEHGDPNLTLPTLDTKANYAQAQGLGEDARRDWLEVARRWISQAPASIYQASRPALWAGDVNQIRADLVAIDATGFHGPVVEARRETMRAGITALEGRAKEAVAMYLRAIEGWRQLKIVWEQALTGLDMVKVLDPGSAEVQQVAEETRQIFGRLGAKPYLEQLDEALTRRDPQLSRQRESAEQTTTERATVEAS